MNQENGKTRISPEVGAERKEALQILKDAAPAMTARLVKLALTSRDPSIAIKACKVVLAKVLPTKAPDHNGTGNGKGVVA